MRFRTTYVLNCAEPVILSMDDKTFFTVMIESLEPEHSFIQVFWTSGKHPGEAIEKVLRACAGQVPDKIDRSVEERRVQLLAGTLGHA